MEDLEKRANGVGDLRVGVVSGGLEIDVRGPVPDVGGDAYNGAPGASVEAGLEPFADGAFARPVFAGERLADDGDKGRSCGIAGVEGTAPQDWNPESAEVAVANGAIARDDFTLNRRGVLAVNGDGH